MPATAAIHLGQVQESLLVPLYGRALDSRHPRPLVTDTRRRGATGLTPT